MTIDPDAPIWPHPACADDAAILAQCDLSKGRTSGPGGQHRNKVETKVMLSHRPTGLDAQASERRSVEDNKRVALRRLRLTMAVELRIPVPDGEIGSALWRARVRRAPPGPPTSPIPGLIPARRPAPPAGRITCSPDHHDFPSLLAEALDVVAASAWDVKTAAVRLGISTTQLVRFLKDHPPAIQKVNAQRGARGEHPLK